MYNICRFYDFIGNFKTVVKKFPQQKTAKNYLNKNNKSNAVNMRHLKFILELL